MAVKVIITRHFRKEKHDQAYKLLMELRSLATLQKGYMSGETLVNAEDPNKVVVVSTWLSQHRWEEWQANPQRKQFTMKLTEYLESPEQVECYLVGEKIAEWVDMA